MVYENKAIDTIQTDWVLNLKLQCVHFVCVAHDGDENFAPSMVSMLPDPYHQTSSFLSLEYGGPSIQL